MTNALRAGNGRERHGDLAAPPELSRGTLTLMAVACGLSVAGNYFAQPLLDTISHDLGIGSTLAALVVTAAQTGYALGLLLLVPLGDLLERRRLAVTLTAATAVLLAVTATARNGPVLLVGTALTGVTSVAAQVLVPFAASLAAPGKSGKAVGTVMSGLLLGILLARTAAGLLADVGTWRTVYYVNAGLMAVLALALWRVLPVLRTPSGLRYPSLLRSLLTLLREEPVLRLRCVMGALVFAAFTVLWTAVAFLLSAPPYDWSDAAIGLFGLVGVAGTLAAGVAGRLADMGRTHLVTGVGAVLLTVSWLPMDAGAHHIGWLVVGVLTLDLAVQAVHISNQNVVYALRPAARNRLNSIYMTSYFLGGVAGSALTSVVRGQYGWTGVCLLGAVVSALTLALGAVEWAGGRPDTR